MTENPPPVNSRRKSLPDYLVEAVHRALDKKPSGRFPNAAAFARALRDPSEDTAVTSRRHLAPVEAVEKHFRLDESLCRRLNRETLDPRIIGDRMSYLDNLRESDVLVIYLHGLGLDQTDFEHTLETISYRAVAPTLYGFEPQRDPRGSIPMADHVVIVRAFIKERLAEFRPRVAVVVGFSAGADLGFRVLDPRADHALEGIDGYLALDCNLGPETCHVSGALAELAEAQADNLLDALHVLGRQPRSLDEWLSMHGYLVRVLKKFGNDPVPLGRFAKDVVDPFIHGGSNPFFEGFSTTAENVTVLRCLFSDEEAYSRAINVVKLAHLDAASLGSRYTHESIQVAVGANHFDLIEQNRLAEQVEMLVRETKEAVVAQ